MLEYFDADVFVCVLRANDSALAGSKTVERTAMIFHVKTKVALEVMDAYMNDHVHALKLGQLLNY
jgi:hypothetical protein